MVTDGSNIWLPSDASPLVPLGLFVPAVLASPWPMSAAGTECLAPAMLHPLVKA